MKIDPRIQLTNEAQAERVKNSRAQGTSANGAANTSGLKPTTGEDTVSLSSQHADVHQLVANLANVPEVRTERVSALQQQVQNGQYHPDSRKVADAMLAEQSVLKV